MKLLKSLILLAALAGSPSVSAEALKLVSFSDNTHAFYHALLSEALAAGNKPVEIEKRADVPQPRISSMLEDGGLDVHWFVQSTERDQKYVGVDVPLTNGLIGQRVFLIRAADQAKYTAVSSVADLKATNFVAGFGQGWFDVAVWKANGLAVHEQSGDWRTLYKMVAAGDRKVDYLSRGVTEIVPEAAANPELVIEKNLLLVYERDFRFYLAPKNKDYAKPLESGLKLLLQNGRHAALMKAHFGETLQTLGVEGRRKITLATP